MQWFKFGVLNKTKHSITCNQAFSTTLTIKRGLVIMHLWADCYRIRCKLPQDRSSFWHVEAHVATFWLHPSCLAFVLDVSVARLSLVEQPTVGDRPKRPIKSSVRWILVYVTRVLVLFQTWTLTHETCTLHVRSNFSCDLKQASRFLQRKKSFQNFIVPIYELRSAFFHFHKCVLLKETHILVSAAH